MGFTSGLDVHRHLALARKPSDHRLVTRGQDEEVRLPRGVPPESQTSHEVEKKPVPVSTNTNPSQLGETGSRGQSERPKNFMCRRNGILCYDWETRLRFGSFDSLTKAERRIFSQCAIRKRRQAQRLHQDVNELYKKRQKGKRRRNDEFQQPKQETADQATTRNRNLEPPPMRQDLTGTVAKDESSGPAHYHGSTGDYKGPPAIGALLQQHPSRSQPKPPTMHNTTPQMASLLMLAKYESSRISHNRHQPQLEFQAAAAQPDLQSKSAQPQGVFKLKPRPRLHYSAARDHDHTTRIECPERVEGPQSRARKKGIPRKMP